MSSDSLSQRNRGVSSGAETTAVICTEGHRTERVQSEIAAEMLVVREEQVARRTKISCRPRNRRRHFHLLIRKTGLDSASRSAVVPVAAADIGWFLQSGR